jgi:hypothetical protein
MDCFEKSQNNLQHRTEYSSEESVSTKTVRRELHKSIIHVRDEIAKPQITECNAQMRKGWCRDLES